MIPKHSAKQTAIRMLSVSKGYANDFESQVQCCHFAINEIIDHLNHENMDTYLKYHKYWGNVRNELHKLELEIKAL